MSRILVRMAGWVAVLAVPAVALAASQVAEKACSCCPWCCSW